MGDGSTISKAPHGQHVEFVFVCRSRVLPFAVKLYRPEFRVERVEHANMGIPDLRRGKR